MTAPAALITGGGRGIGRAAALAFARAGYDVAVASRSPAELEQTAAAVRAAGRRCETLVADLADPAAAEQIVHAARRSLGRLNVVVNNAGAATLHDASSFPLADFQRMLDVNLTAVLAVCRAAWPILASQGGGVIVNVSSVAARDPFPGLGAYGATKAAVNVLTRALADEGRPRNIRVFALGPGAVDTAMLRAAFPQFPADQCLQPEDVAEFIVGLADPRWRHASGEFVCVRR